MSHFKCCTGHPFQVPDLYFTPLPCEWQRPDFRPLHFPREGRHSYKERCPATYPGALCQATYEHEFKAAVISGSNTQAILAAASDPMYDRLLVVVRSWEEKTAFINQFKDNMAVRSKAKIYLRRGQVSLREVGERYLQGEEYDVLG